MTFNPVNDLATVLKIEGKTIIIKVKLIPAHKGLYNHQAARTSHFSYGKRLGGASDSSHQMSDFGWEVDQGMADKRAQRVPRLPVAKGDNAASDKDH